MFIYLYNFTFIPTPMARWQGDTFTTKIYECLVPCLLEQGIKLPTIHLSIFSAVIQLVEY